MSTLTDNQPQVPDGDIISISFDQPQEFEELEIYTSSDQTQEDIPETSNNLVPSPADLQDNCDKFKARFDHLIDADYDIFNGLILLCCHTFPISRAIAQIVEIIDHAQYIEVLTLYRLRFLEIVFKHNHNIPDFDRLIEVILSHVENP